MADTEDITWSSIAFWQPRLPGTQLVATGLFHIGLGLADPVMRKNMIDMFNEGILNSVNTRDRANFYWYMGCGSLLVLCGYMLNKYERDSLKPAPSSFGILLMAASAGGLALGPRTVWPLCVLQGANIVRRGSHKWTTDTGKAL
eukprot:Colp12_sorted_trinity150504_noHs@10815